MTFGITVGDVGEAREMGETTDDLIQKKQQEHLHKQIKSDLISSDFEQAIYMTIRGVSIPNDDDLLWNMLAMNFHKSFSPGGYESRIAGVKGILGNNFRQKYADRYRLCAIIARENIDREIRQTHASLIKRRILYSQE